MSRFLALAATSGGLPGHTKLEVTACLGLNLMIVEEEGVKWPLVCQLCCRGPSDAGELRQVQGFLKLCQASISEYPSSSGSSGTEKPV